MMTERMNLLNLWKRNTGGKAPVLQVRAGPSPLHMVGYQPAKVERIFTVERID
jgi:hypothetical protein